MEKKLTSRDRQHMRTRQLILDTANKLFKERRYEDVSIKDICSACGVSVGSFYHHFGSKEHLVELFYNEFDVYIGRFYSEFKTLPPFEALLKLVEYEMDYLSKNVTYPAQICIMQLLSGNTAFSQENREYYQCINLITDRIFEHHQTAGLTKDQFRAALLRHTRGVLYDWCLHSGDYDLKEQALQDIRLLVEGLCAMGKLEKGPAPLVQNPEAPENA